MTPCRVLVSDSSVLIDIERGALLEAAFSMSYELCVPDLLYHQELADHGELTGRLFPRFPGPITSRSLSRGTQRLRPGDR